MDSSTTDISHAAVPSSSNKAKEVLRLSKTPFLSWRKIGLFSVAGTISLYLIQQ
jgi:hypothetical protein